MGWVIVNSTPWTTGSPVGDLTSYGIATVIGLAAWRLFQWYRADQRSVEGDHHDELRKLRRNVAKLQGYVAVLLVTVARLGGDVPDPPELEE